MLKLDKSFFSRKHRFLLFLYFKQNRYIQPPLPLSQHQPFRGKRQREQNVLDDWMRLSVVPLLLKERRFAMEILTHIIFVLNLLKSLINHFF